MQNSTLFVEHAFRITSGKNRNRHYGMDGAREHYKQAAKRDYSLLAAWMGGINSSSAQPHRRANPFQPRARETADKTNYKRVCGALNQDASAFTSTTQTQLLHDGEKQSLRFNV